MKNYINISDIEDLQEIITEALQLKKENSAAGTGKGKTLGLLFFNPSLRTRLSTEKAAKLLGMEVMIMNADKDGWALEFEDGAVMDSNKAEHIKEAAAVLSQYCDIIGVRAFPGLQDREKDEQDVVINSFLKYAEVPVINLESATGHPLQALTDAITVTELKKIKRPKVVLTWAPHPRALPQSVPNSFVEVMQKMEVDLVITNPEGYDLAPEITGKTPVIHKQEEALKNADFVYVKNWSSYEKYGQILSKDNSWTFNNEKLERTNNAKVMHCLPVRRNVVIADEVLDGPNSIVIQQAGNRTFAAQVVLKKLLEK
ncbi:N-acetylornithine carbamoyltransferase [Antarcticibacterium flavum]|uniref:N-succinylornithine carbamoyltransferase n=1 Tax=Antarcticibacterium flavum TaxID=2058175 RepID=A0A5B7X0D3_9FLAO|nr:MULTISPECIES: N-acetylornithine carbamoyltransferase [Antarcticibacterium]MCM4160229.1 N-acetylornithine carbamoyltransferase [Antarcticibacterium sp. W02-3]QCY68695.1 N-acetylornithine carbamoyltransferase [Antarcticibacterium flavum]